MLYEVVLTFEYVDEILQVTIQMKGTVKAVLCCGAVSSVKMCQQSAILPPSVKLYATYFTLDFTRNPQAGKGTWHLLPTTPTMLSNATKHFDRVVLFIMLCKVVQTFASLDDATTL